MRKALTKMFICLLCVTLVLSGTPSARAEWTTLQVAFFGLTVEPNGALESKALSGTFEVMQNGQKVGTITADSVSGSDFVTLPEAMETILIPDMSTMPEGYAIVSTGYSVAVSAGRLNTANIWAYANRGLFRLIGKPNAAYVLQPMFNTEDQLLPLEAKTDDQGIFQADRCMPIGNYMIKDAQTQLPLMMVELGVYYGMEEQVTVVDLSAAQTAVAVTPAIEMPAVPAAEVTPEPTAVPTEQPEATEEPVAEDPAEEPAAEATEEPAEEPAAEATEEPAEEPAAEEPEDPAEEPAAEEPAEESEVEETEEPAEPEVTEAPDEASATEAPIELPAAPAGEEAAARAMTVEPEADKAVVTGQVEGIRDGAPVIISGVETYMLSVENGIFVSDQLVPGDYLVEVLFPATESYLGEGWEIGDAGAERIASRVVRLQAGELLQLPVLTLVDTEASLATVTDLTEPSAAPTLNGEVQVPVATPAFAPEIALTLVLGTPTAAPVEATETPAPTLEPTATPTVEPTVAPTTVPAQEPVPVATPAFAPEIALTLVLGTPTAVPAETTETPAPTAEPTATPAVEPTAEPTVVPAQEPAALPTSEVEVASPETPLPFNGMGAPSLTIDLSDPTEAPAPTETATNAPVVTPAPAEATKVPVFSITTAVPENYQAEDTSLLKTVAPDVTVPAGPAISLILTTEAPETPEDEDDADQTEDLLPEVTAPQETEAPTPAPTPVWTDAPLTPVPTDAAPLTAINDVEIPLTLFEAEATPVPQLPADDTAPEEPQQTAAPTPAPTATLSPFSRSDAEGHELMYIHPRELPTRSELLGTGSANLTVAVFYDGNANGERGVYEREVENAQVEVILASGEGDVIVSTSLTNGKGMVTFRGLPAGAYRIRTTLPAGYGYAPKGRHTDSLESSVMDEQSAGVQESDIFTLSESQTYNAGVAAVRTSTITGQCWLDENADGIRQNTEPGMAGVMLQAVGASLTYQAYSDENGYYTIAQILPDTYKLRATTPEGMSFTRYSAKGGNNRSIITTEGADVGVKVLDLNKPKTVAEQNVGFVEGASIAVVCFIDLNYNGVMDDGEPPLPGVKVQMNKQGNDNLVGVVMSNENGVALFDSVRRNTYKIRAILPDDGHSFTVTGTGERANQFKSPTGRRENTLNNVFLENDTSTVIYLGAMKPGTVSGTVYRDDNFSGSLDGSEQPVQGMQVVLAYENGTVADTQNTNAKGQYTFRNVLPGQYSVRVTATAGYAFTKPGDGNQMINRGNGAGSTEPFYVISGAEITGINAGMILPGLVKGSFFADLNDNAQRDGSDMGMKGAVVRLMGEEGEAFSATVGLSGEFTFDAVMPGTYYVSYELPADSVFNVVPASGTLVSDGVAESERFEINSGSNLTLEAFGGLTYGRINGHFWSDDNANGAQEADEANLAGVRVTLTPTRPELESRQLTTGEDGAFSLEQLRPDQYTFTFELPEGLVLSRQTDYSLGLTTGQRTQSTQMTVDMGTQELGLAFGGVAPASMSGYVWLDANNNGVMEEGEATPAGEVIHVMDLSTNSEYGSMTTDEKGFFYTSGMIPGNYSLVYTPASGTISAIAGDTTFTVAGSNLVMESFQLKKGEHRKDIRLGLVRYTSVGGYVWVDRGGDLLPLQGAGVAVFDINGVEHGRTTSGADGRYTIGGLLPGWYGVTVMMPEGQVAVEQNDERITSGKASSVLTYCSGRQGQSNAFEIVMGEDRMNLDMGSVLPGVIGDRVWLDENGNGLQDSEDGGIPNVTVHLLRDGAVVASTVTDQYGFFTFGDLYPATYTLRADAPAQVRPTAHRTDFTNIISVLLESGESVPLTVLSDTTNYDLDLGYALVTAGQYPAGYGTGATQAWQ